MDGVMIQLYYDSDNVVEKQTWGIYLFSIVLLGIVLVCIYLSSETVNKRAF